MGSRRRYAIVGTGGRAVSYVDAICGPHADAAELVGLCDVSPTRLAWHNRRIARRFGGDGVAAFEAGGFARMVRETRPDAVIVTTVDADHDRYIVEALELGCDAVTEKPLATDEAKVARILDAVERTGGSLRVTFNYRYMPAFTKLRELMLDGAVGRPTLVHFSWVLDTSHGADYFRRWHRERASSGGLLVHKASHHFDLVNWWISSSPAEVFAFGDLAFYGAARAAERGERYGYDRYTGHDEARSDPFALFLDDHRGLRGLYLDAEADTGYRRDQNVFGTGITIEDTAAVTARYRNGALLAYSLVAYSPWEGLRVDITGTEGRIEYHERHGSHIVAGQGDGDLAAAEALGFEQSLRVHPMFGRPRAVEVPTASGGHGGGDPALLADLLSADPSPDPFGRAATHVDGAAAALVGIAANRSMDTGLPVRCDDLVPLR
jgi:predicted dehydrogenase